MPDAAGPAAATLRLTRRARGIELRRRPFEISLDGKTAGRLAPGETAQLPLEPGHHTVRLRAGRYRSPERTFDAADGETVEFRCYAVRLWVTYVASLVSPDHGITLRRERIAPGS